jgi:hypothetical protein
MSLQPHAMGSFTIITKFAANEEACHFLIEFFMYKNVSGEDSGRSLLKQTGNLLCGRKKSISDRVVLTMAAKILTSE